MKKDPFIEDVYGTLCGLLIEEARVPGVENLYAQGKPCMEWYSKALDAYRRLCDRLGVAEEDEDVEVIFDSFLSICRETGYYMYRYGAQFGDEE